MNTQKNNGEQKSNAAKFVHFRTEDEEIASRLVKKVARQTEFIKSLVEDAERLESELDLAKAKADRQQQLVKELSQNGESLREELMAERRKVQHLAARRDYYATLAKGWEEELRTVPKTVIRFFHLTRRLQAAWKVLVG